VQIYSCLSLERVINYFSPSVPELGVRDMRKSVARLVVRATFVGGLKGW
jgi:hypothetical protein